MQDFEKLGAFYLGKAYDPESDTQLDELVLYDAKDLTTHAVIIGMTGSGKTGLGISLLEEAAIDHIPVIAIDPKGDLGNLLLTFPDLRAEDFRPWVNSRTAADQGMTPEAFAQAQADLWREGLARWGQDGARIARLRDNADLAIFTPGSSAGRPVSVLRSFDAPPEAGGSDRDLYRERIQATATSLLALLGENADPLTSREHILIATILEDSWNQGRSLDLGGLIAAVQQPPVARIGVMDLDAFYPASDRFGLAMKLNNLLAAPGFEVWMQGEPLSAQKLLYTDTGKPRVSVLSIAHLSDSERMFFVTMLLGELISWMRAQPGTSTLRAILYMDEIFGYMPPVANPPSKTLFLTLLKQARAYGLGLVLATQNPVDLDYKGLSNTGTWFIGRLQTERDKARVMEGLEGAATGGHFDRSRTEQILAGLGKRRFLLHNVHEDHPVVFHTRWAMSYLPGPLTRDQIRLLTPQAGNAATTAAPVAQAAASGTVQGKLSATPPLLPPEVPQCYLPVTQRASAEQTLVYLPRILGAAEVAYSSARYQVNETRSLVCAGEIEDGPVPVDWDQCEILELTPSELEKQGQGSAEYGECTAPAHDAKNYGKWAKQFNRWVRNEQPLTLWCSPALKLVSAPGESEAAFRIRLQEKGNELRDIAVENLRRKYAAKISTQEDRLRRAEQAIEREQGQASQRKMDTAISFGTAMLGVVFGRKKVSSTSAGRFGTAMKNLGRSRREADDVGRAEETAAAAREKLLALNQELEREIEKFGDAYDAQKEQFDEIRIKAKSTDLTVHFAGLAWAPYYRNPDRSLTAAFG